MKKKNISLVVILLVLIIGICACGQRNIENPPSDKPASQKENTKRQTKSVVEEFVKKHPDFNGEKESGLFGFLQNASNAKGSILYEATCETEVCYDDGIVSLPIMPNVPFNTEEYNVIDENGFRKVMYSPLSTFSADVDTASFSNVRRFIESGRRVGEIPKGSVRTEELLNYFTYNYKLPENGAPFGVTTELGDCPWNSNNKLLSIGVKTERIDFSQAGNSNIVFLIDVSGSMFSDEKLPLLVKSFKLMLNELGEKDKVSIVTYAGEDKILLEGVPASEKEMISEMLDSLEANGCTNGGQGIVSAYRLAERNFIEGGNNRVILATDGDLNVGITSASDLEELIKEESKTGIFLTVLGFGTGNYSDARMETLADNGNGNYAYIDNITEAKKVLCEELGATMVTVAKDVKFQVEFNPAVVAEYRLIGYEDRELQAEDFNNDAKDAGEIGAGHSVTALYEIVLANEEYFDGGLKYQEAKLKESSEWLTVNIRYKEPSGDTSKLLSYAVGIENYKEKNSDDFYLAATVAEFSQILRGEEFVDGLNMTDVLKLLEKVEISDSYRESFKEMVTYLNR